MIRGAQKKMIVIRTHDSRVFEEAYFVMRRDTEAPTEAGDMLLEADRIIRRHVDSPHTDLSSSSHSQRRRHPWISRICWLIAGVLLGSGGTGLFFWLA